MEASCETSRVNQRRLGNGPALSSGANIVRKELRFDSRRKEGGGRSPGQSRLWRRGQGDLLTSIIEGRAAVARWLLSRRQQVVSINPLGSFRPYR